MQAPCSPICCTHPATHVLDVGGVEGDALLEAAERLGEQLLRVDGVEGAALLAAPARCPDGIDDVGGPHDMLLALS
jgi:hypothetical protein